MLLLQVVCFSNNIMGMEIVISLCMCTTLAESDDDVWSSSEEEDKQPEKKIGSLEMLIPKGYTLAQLSACVTL